MLAIAFAAPTRLVRLSPVDIIIIVFGNPSDYGQLRKIANITGGQAYQITDPKQVGKVFYEALAHRLCDPNCVAA